MEPVQIAEALKEKFPEEVLSIDEFRGQVSVTVRKGMILDMCRFLHDSPEFLMKHLRDITAVDYMGKKDVRFEVVYHLFSIKHKNMLRIKAQVGEEDCSIDSVTSLWKGADWHERECYDLMGVKFRGHPDLRRVLLPEDWVGHPLRKDYPVTGPAPEEDWPGYKEVLEKSERFKEFEWNR